MSGEISRDYSINEPSNLQSEQPKTIEREVNLPGLDHSLKITILTNQKISQDQIDQALAQSVNAIQGLANELNTSPSRSMELELTVTKPNTQETEKIRTVIEKISPKEIEQRVRKLTTTESKVQMIVQAVLTHGEKALEQVKASQQKVLVNTQHPDVQLVATKSGALYVKVSILGAGKFKETVLFAKVIDQNREMQAKLAAVGIPKASDLPPEDPERMRLEREYQNEMSLHKTLTTLRKEATKNDQPDPLSHVATSKAITSSDPPGVALMGAAYNGGNVNTRLQANDLRPEEKALICADFLTGTAQLHAAKVVHRDIKADNILLQTEERLIPQDQWPRGLTPNRVPSGYKVELEHGKIKNVRQTVITQAILCDLGKGSHVAPDKRFYNSTLYNEMMPPGRFTHPDVLYSNELDVYSAGRTAYQIFAGIPVQNFKGVARQSPERKVITDQFTALFKQIRETKDETVLADLKAQIRTLDQQLIAWDVQSLGPPENWFGWNTIPPKVQDYIKRMVDVDPSKRPTAAEAASFFRTLPREDLTSSSESIMSIENESLGYQSEGVEGYRSIGYSSEEAA